VVTISSEKAKAPRRAKTTSAGKGRAAKKSRQNATQYEGDHVVGMRTKNFQSPFRRASRHIATAHNGKSSSHITAKPRQAFMECSGAVLTLFLPTRDSSAPSC